MATSSSDDSSTAPKNFHISSSVDSSSRQSSPKQRCPLCGTLRKVFYCKRCVISGSFVHSKQLANGCYSERKKALVQTDDSRRNLEKKVLKSVEIKQQIDALGSRIRQQKERNRIIKLAVEEKRQLKAQYSADLVNLQEEVKKATENLHIYEQNVHKMENRAEGKLEKIPKYQAELDKLCQEIMKLIKIRIEQLRLVFPINKVQPRTDRKVMSALADASENYGEMKSATGELQYSVVEPILPASGDYKLYNLWVAENKDQIPANQDPNPVEHNPAFTISGALTYTAQLVNILAFYFDVRLPYRMLYSDFCGSVMDEAQFNRRVGRLNANIVYLCFTQNIDLTTVKLCQTVPNLLKLTDTSNPNLGRQGPVDADRYKTDFLETPPVARDASGENTDSDEGDSFHREWETVPHIPCQEVPAGPTVAQSTQVMATQQQATSMAGGLVTSAAASLVSMWRGITGR